MKDMDIRGWEIFGDWELFFDLLFLILKVIVCVCGVVLEILVINESFFFKNVYSLFI